MARIMGLDTSTEATGIGILNTDTMDAEVFRILNDDRLRAERVIEVCDELLREAGLVQEDIDAFAVSVGPGSFTGTRIGVTMAKTMAQVSGKPLFGISSLKALATEGVKVAADRHTLYIPIVDARGNRVYAAGYHMTVEGWTTAFDEDLYTEDQLIKRVRKAAPQRIFWCGAGLLQHELLPLSLLDIDQERLEGSAAVSPVMAVMTIAAARLLLKDWDDTLDLVPHYLRRSQAERDADATLRAQGARTLRLDPATREDVHAIGRLETEGFARPWSNDAILSELALPTTDAIVARWGQSVVGYLIGSHVSGESSVNRITVAPNMRRRGIGKKLLQRFLEHAQDNEVALEVRESNEPALWLYERSGFYSVGRRPGYYDGEDGIILKRPRPDADDETDAASYTETPPETPGKPHPEEEGEDDARSGD